MKVYSKICRIGALCTFVAGMAVATSASAAVFQFGEGLAFNKQPITPPFGFNFSVLHHASHQFDASGKTTHRLKTDVGFNDLSADARDDVLLPFWNNLGGDLSYKIDNGPGGNTDITAPGALDGATLSFMDNSFTFRGKKFRPDGVLSLGGDLTLSYTPGQFAGDHVLTPFGLALPEYQLSGQISFTFQLLDSANTLMTGTMNMMPGTMGPFNGLAVGAGSRAEDVTMYIWAASSDPMQCNCEYNGKHLGMDLALWGTGTPTSNVPEPGALALIGAGLAGIGYMRRPRRTA